MKRVITGCLVLLLAIVGSLYCVRNSEKGKDEILGTWKFHHFSPIEIVTDNEEVTRLIEETVTNSFRLHAVYTFYGDGRMYWISGKNHGNSPYIVEGNKITFTFDGETLTKEFSLKDDAFAVYSDYTEYFWDYGLYYLGIDPNSVKISKVIVAKNFVRKESSSKQQVE